MISHPADPQHTTGVPAEDHVVPDREGRGPLAERRGLLALAPVLLMVAVTLTDLLTPRWLHVAPVMAAVPVLAAAVLPVPATAALGGAALVLTLLLQTNAGQRGSPDSNVVLCALIVVGLASLVTCALRRRRERQLRQARSVAETAQRALMHPLPRRMRSLALSGVYLPAESEARIGGDFYEAVHTPYGTRILIGDVRSKGLPAVGASATLLGAFRELADREASLTTVARQLDERAQRHIAALDGRPEDGEPEGKGTGALFTERFATALLVEFPPGEAVARIVHCGHPEPLIVRAGRVHAHVPEHPGAPLGLGDLLGAAPVAQTVAFGPGDRLVLYTDGFIEARDRRGRFYDLTAHTHVHAGRPLPAMVAALRRALLRHVGGDLDDDAALVALERLPCETGRG
ncbi:serine phosphatase RsbU (regulator of sigma subunit) [Streptomyces griseochromogenes]|uniref:Serine phosphatase RsbU (Regulator of sigma subunit) n=1 Tax=Streptomyces griseochromogenes TaxID=68214 RepID=A0ABS4LIH3_9ACTN|nr:PP2C family protein-serine/threonine phosphatase [Streptomyces griseochromogenes]MBP2047181.1 serine phosphatase RsbU (regulator of sigma subunit) [Streptomyces griseochromogenes]